MSLCWNNCADINHQIRKKNNERSKSSSSYKTFVRQTWLGKQFEEKLLQFIPIIMHTLICDFSCYRSINPLTSQTITRYQRRNFGEYLQTNDMTPLIANNVSIKTEHKLYIFDKGKLPVINSAWAPLAG